MGPGGASARVPSCCSPRSTDYTGNVPAGGYSYPNDPINQNPYLPAISNGVMLSQASGGLSNTTVGPLPDGTTYGPSGFNQNAGGTTGWVTTCYTFTAAGQYQLVWEVANVFGTQGGDALATDNITLNGNQIVQFQPGGTLPAGYTGLGSYGTSAGVTGLPTSGGDSRLRLDGRPAYEQHGRRADLRHIRRGLLGVPVVLGDDLGQGGGHALR